MTLIIVKFLHKIGAIGEYIGSLSANRLNELKQAMKIALNIEG